MKSIIVCVAAGVVFVCLTVGTAVLHSQPLPGRILLKFAHAVDTTMFYHDPQGILVTGMPSIDALNQVYRVTDMFGIFTMFENNPGYYTIQLTNGMDRCFLALMDPGMDVEDAAADYGADPNVEFGETDHAGENAGTQYIPNDSDFGNQWGLHNEGWHGGRPDADIDAPEAWNIARGDSGVLIAVLDAGTNFNHIDLEDNVWVNPGEDGDGDRVVFDGDDIDGVDDDNNGYVDDLIGWDFVQGDNNPKGDTHGTRVAGVLAAVTDNSDSVAAIAFNCRLMIVRTGNDNGPPDATKPANGINYATGNGANVINMSWYFGSPQQTIKTALNAAYAAGVVLVACAGNGNNESMLYPAAYEDSQADVIAVAATDKDDKKASFSQFGTWIDVCAPGDSILTIKLSDELIYENGTSFSAPMVSGLAALMLSLEPGLSNDFVVSQIETTADNIDSLNLPMYAGKLGSGRISAAKALHLNLRGWLAQRAISSDIAGYSQGDPAIAAWGDTVVAVWTRMPFFIGTPEVYFSRSTDAGMSWSAQTMVSSDDGTYSQYPTVCVNGSEVYAAWVESGDILCSYSSDGGQTFGTPFNASGTAASSEGPDIAMTDSLAHLVWLDVGSGTDDVKYRALDNGSTSGAVKNVSSLGASYSAIGTKVAAAGQYVQVVWEQTGTGSTYVNHRRNTDHGNSNSWSSKKILVRTDDTGARDPDVACTEDNVYVVYRRPAAGDENMEVFIRRNQQSGNPNSWDGAKQLTDHNEDPTPWEPRVATLGSDVEVVYNAWCPYNSEIYHLRSSDAGGGFTDPERVTYSEGDSGDKGIALQSAEADDTPRVYLIFREGAGSGTSEVAFKIRAPQLDCSMDDLYTYDFDSHDLTGWPSLATGGNSIGIVEGGGTCVSCPNVLKMMATSPGLAWVTTPTVGIRMDLDYWIGAHFMLESTCDQILVFENGDIRLEVLGGQNLVTGGGTPVETLTPYTWYDIECRARPDDGQYDVFINEEYAVTDALAGGPVAEVTLGDVLDGPLGYGIARWDDLVIRGFAEMAGIPRARSDDRAEISIWSCPNPATRSARLKWDAPGVSGDVTVTIYDVTGRLVRRLLELEAGAASGVTQCDWDGMDDLGRRVSPGIYFAAIATGRGSAAAKILLLH